MNQGSNLDERDVKSDGVSNKNVCVEEYMWETKRE